MSKIFPFAVIALLIAVSCRHKVADDGYHLQPKTMQQVLADVNLAEALSIVVKDTAHKPGTKNFDSLAVYYASIFSHYKITPGQFTQSLEWYKANPDKLDTMYTAILARVTAIQSKLPAPAVANPPSPVLPLPPPPMPPHYMRPDQRLHQAPTRAPKH